MAQSRAKIRIKGKVQGVFFRDHVRRHADSEGVTGWVRNLPDGNVEAVLEGERQAIEKLLEVCREGPPRAEVEDLQVDWEASRDEFSTFEVRR